MESGPREFMARGLRSAPPDEARVRTVGRVRIHSSRGVRVQALHRLAGRARSPASAFRSASAEPEFPQIACRFPPRYIRSRKQKALPFRSVLLQPDKPTRHAD